MMDSVCGTGAIFFPLIFAKYVKNTELKNDLWGDVLPYYYLRTFNIS